MEEIKEKIINVGNAKAKKTAKYVQIRKTMESIYPKPEKKKIIKITKDAGIIIPLNIFKT
jgi:hypothetical protein